MANALGIDLTGKTLRVRDTSCLFKVEDEQGHAGFGALSFTAGVKVFGHWVTDDGRPLRSGIISGWDVVEVVE